MKDNVYIHILLPFLEQLKLTNDLGFLMVMVSTHNVMYKFLSIFDINNHCIYNSYFGFDLFKLPKKQDFLVNGSYLEMPDYSHRYTGHLQH
jgi:hypothetical protein